jgi:predicted Zn-ribbon and HTH transcriptional regulator
MVTYQRHVCQRCGFEWLPRTENPKQCPNCHSYRWASLPQVKKASTPSEEIKTEVKTDA